MSSTPSPSDSPVIQPMHNPSQAAVVQQPLAPIGNASNGLFQGPGQGTKAMLAKRMASKGNPKYISPTDNMVTPCTAKISQSKKKHFNKPGKPIQLFQKTETATETSEPSEDEPSPIPVESKSHPEAMAVDDENPF